MKRYWVAVVSHEHVKMGVEGGFAMLCHGKEAPLRSMSTGDQLLYYSPTERFGQKEPCQKFTALGTVQDSPPAQHKISEDLISWKRDTLYAPITKISIRPLILHLSFIKNKKYWGMAFRRGLFSIPKEDFILITKNMGNIQP